MAIWQARRVWLSDKAGSAAPRQRAECRLLRQAGSDVKKRGYQFISLDEALKDKAYTSPDTYAGPGGITWVHRWAVTAGKDDDFFRGEPRTPAFVMKEAGVTAE